MSRASQLLSLSFRQLQPLGAALGEQGTESQPGLFCIYAVTFAELLKHRIGRAVGPAAERPEGIEHEGGREPLHRAVCKELLALLPTTSWRLSATMPYISRLAEIALQKPTCDGVL